jgi:hypothetical protein
MNTTYYSFFRRLAPMFNFTVGNNSLQTMLRVWDVVNVDNYLGRPLPSGFTADDEANVLHLANWYFALTYQGNVSSMFSSGKLEKVFSVFDNRVRLPENYQLKWTFLSGHDSDLFAMQTGMNLTSFTCIEELYRKGSTSALNCETGANLFGANLMFELHSDDESNFYVKVRSNGRYVNLCGKNSTQCDYLDFKGSYRKIISSNIEQLCGKKIGNGGEQKPRAVLLKES